VFIIEGKDPVNQHTNIVPEYEIPSDHQDVPITANPAYMIHKNF